MGWACLEVEMLQVAPGIDLGFLEMFFLDFI